MRSPGFPWRRILTKVSCSLALLCVGAQSQHATNLLTSQTRVQSSFEPISGSSFQATVFTGDLNLTDYDYTNNNTQTPLFSQKNSSSSSSNESAGKQSPYVFDAFSSPQPSEQASSATNPFNPFASPTNVFALPHYRHI